MGEKKKKNHSWKIAISQKSKNSSYTRQKFPKMLSVYNALILTLLLE